MKNIQLPVELADKQKVINAMLITFNNKPAQVFIYTDLFSKHDISETIYFLFNRFTIENITPIDGHFLLTPEQSLHL